ncbi:hypothetical protein CPB85DRAFT_1506316 [Mucidula mucida]|nr:hypothetical protein CPB85DRAFT_1506316 [Mucidula mucida]
MSLTFSEGLLDAAALSYDITSLNSNMLTKSFIARQAAPSAMRSISTSEPTATENRGGQHLHYPPARASTSAKRKATSSKKTMWLHGCRPRRDAHRQRREGPSFLEQSRVAVYPPKRRLICPGEVQPILKRVEGDTYQGPNTNGAYFFVVQQTSAVHGEDGATSFDEEQQSESDWTAAFNRVYNANNGGTTVNSESAGSQGEYLHAQLTVTEGVIHDIHPEDADPLITALNDFRDQQNNPFTFVVGVYTGVVGHPDAGLIGDFRWFAE